MSLSTGTKIVLGAAGVLAVGALVKSQVSKFKDAASNFTFNVLFKRIHSLKNNILTVVYAAEIKNLSGITVTAKNAFVLLQFSSDNGMNWDNIGASNKRISIPLQDNQTAKVDMEVQVNLSDTLTSLLAKSNRYRIVIKYEVFGAQQQYVKAYDFTKNLKSIPGFKGIDGVKKAATLGQKKDMLKSIVINIRHVYAFPFSQTGKLKAGIPQRQPGLPKKSGSPIPPKLTKILRINKPPQSNPISPVIKAIKPALPVRPVAPVLKPVIPIVKPKVPALIPIVKPLPAKPIVTLKPGSPIRPIAPVKPAPIIKAPLKPALPIKPISLPKAILKPIVKPAVKQFKGNENLI